MCISDYRTLGPQLSQGLPIGWRPPDRRSANDHLVGLDDVPSIEGTMTAARAVRLLAIMQIAEEYLGSSLPG